MTREELEQYKRQLFKHELIETILTAEGQPPDGPRCSKRIDELVSMSTNELMDIYWAL